MLRYRDIAELEKLLVERGASFLESAKNELVTSAPQWFRSETDSTRVLDEETVARLCESVHSNREEHLRQLAAGALWIARSEAATASDRARFVARFALKRIEDLTNRPRRWSGVDLPAELEAQAQAMFEQSGSYDEDSDLHLIEYAREFVARFEGSADMFGRCHVHAGSRPASMPSGVEHPTTARLCARAAARVPLRCLRALSTPTPR